MSTGFGQPRTTSAQRDEVEALVSNLAAYPGELAFDEPWQVRAFALAVAAHHAGQYPWHDFQQALISSIRGWEDSVEDLSDASWSYFEHWVNALEHVLHHGGQLDAGDMQAKTQQVLDTPANRNHHEPHYEPVAIDPAVELKSWDDVPYAGTHPSR